MGPGVTRRVQTGLGCVMALWVCAAATVASAQSQGAPPDAKAQSTPAQPAPTKPAASPPAKAQPSLDELLGLDAERAKQPADKASGGEGGKDAEGVKGNATDPTSRDLARRLSPQEVNDQFLQAVDLMDEAATRLADQVDTGLDTQRLQQSIILKLDQLIDQAQRNRSSSSSSQSQQQNQQQQSQGAQGQRQSSQAQQQGTQPSDAAQGGEVAQQRAKPRQAPAGSGAAWGSLPPHVRDALVQGSTDSFSATYQRWTEEYYLRLARQGGAGAGDGPGASGGESAPSPQARPATGEGPR